MERTRQALEASVVEIERSSRLLRKTEEIAIFFSKVAIVTFGGAYAVLAYGAQRASEARRSIQLKTASTRLKELFGRGWS